MNPELVSPPPPQKKMSLLFVWVMFSRGTGATFSYDELREGKIRHKKMQQAADAAQ